MGKFKCPRWCRCFSCFRAKFTPDSDVALQPLPRPKEADDTDGVPFIDSEKEADVLIIRNVDPCVNVNGPLHHTAKYELMNRQHEPQLVVRRGQGFYLSIALSRPYNAEKDGISFIFTVEDEEKPSYGHATLVAVPLLRRPDPALAWNVVLEAAVEASLKVLVYPAADAVVARWRMEIDTKIIGDGAYSYCWDTPIYLLFNPWCKSDQVYLRSDDWREEAVLADVGLIWRGTANRMRPVIWKYDQFDRDVLECALYLVHVVGRVRAAARADPVQVGRAVAASVNSADDEGAVMGNWAEDDMGGGTHPTKWLGSREILQKYYKKKKPVKYGQCWVFSGVVTTICRALGIPSRVITNYSSAHDTQNSLTVDYFMDDKGKVMEEMNSDSIWNFHVWNEAWMQRPDLGKEYGGWQAIDATPQEMSEELFRVGPASVVAVKRGEILRPYDSAFLFAEVNADKVYWRYTGPTQPLKLLRKDIFGIGKLIITKSPGVFDMEDITSSYKFPEKSGEERTTMFKALRQSENLFARYYLNEEFNDIQFNFKLLDDIKIGEPFNVILSMKNHSKEKNYKITAIIRVDVVTYTGKLGSSVKAETFNLSVEPNSTVDAKLLVVYEEYYKRLVSQCAFNISCLATVEDTKFEYYAQDDFRVRKPDIKITLQEKPVENKEVTADISVENTLPVPLRKCEFTVEAPGIEHQLKIRIKSTVPPGESAQAEFTFTPPHTGRHTVAAKFVCKEMDDVDGFLIIMVEPNSTTEQQNGSRI